MIAVKCDRCEQELNTPGALVFSPPDGQDVKKYHVCLKCWQRLVQVLMEPA